MNYHIQKDGSYEIHTDGGALLNAWPGWDHQDLRCTRIDAQTDHIIYHTPQGQVELRFILIAGRLEISTILRGFAQMPHWLCPIHQARIEGFTRLFRQGIGFSGPSGFVDLSAQDAWAYESYLLTGLATSADKILVTGAEGHRDFLCRSQTWSRVFHQNFRNRETEKVLRFFELGFRTENITAGDEVTLPTLLFTEGDDPFATLRDFCENVAARNNVSFHSTPRYHHCTWYYNGRKMTRNRLDELLAGIEQTDPQKHLQTVQIDDAYMTSRGDWLTFKEHNWPGGMRPAFEAIQEAGYTPGVWVAPFMVGSESELARNHPDWLLHHANGERMVEWKNYGSDTEDFEHYILDTSNPDALAWIAEVFRTFRSWGVRFFKTDFLEWGYKDSTVVRRFQPGKTGAQYFDDVLRTIRESIGDESYWLGCITYFAPSIGYLDGMRVAADVSASWNLEHAKGNDGIGGGVPNMIEESFATLYFNNIFWQNDPDVVFLRDWFIHHSQLEFESLARWQALLGSSINTSDPLGKLSEERQKWWRWMRPAPEPGTANLPCFSSSDTQKNGAIRVVTRDYPNANGSALLILNSGTDKQFVQFTLGELTGKESAELFTWNPGSAQPLGEHSHILIELAPHESVLYFVSDDGNPPPIDLNLGGSFE